MFPRDVTKGIILFRFGYVRFGSDLKEHMVGQVTRVPVEIILCIFG